MSICTYICCRFKRKTEAQAIFPNSFTIRSSCKLKLVLCPFVYEKIYKVCKRTKRICPLMKRGRHLLSGQWSDFPQNEPNFWLYV